jgi:CDP-diacylglycerol--glycerol-3-phosphate 3-phosphatidyltransferase
MTLPNALTLWRIAGIPVYFFLHAQGLTGIGLTVLVSMMLTDALDGMCARRLHQETPLGALLDPIADKIFILTYFGFLYWQAIAPGWYVAIIYARNIAQLMAIPILSWCLKREFQVRPRWPAKWASALSFIVILVCVLHEFQAVDLVWVVVEYVVIPITVLLELYILVTYLPRLWQIARGRHDTFH